MYNNLTTTTATTTTISYTYIIGNVSYSGLGTSWYGPHNPSQISVQISCMDFHADSCPTNMVDLSRAISAWQPKSQIR